MPEPAHIADLYGELHLAEAIGAPPRTPGLRALAPGLAVCGVAAAAAGWLADRYAFPIVLLGLLIGLSLNFVSSDPRTHPGLDFAARTGLRIGIVLLGGQVTFAQAAALGPAPFAGLIAVMVVTIAAGWLGARAAGQSLHAGLLAGGATAICGASAALALYGVIGRRRLPLAQFSLTLMGISLASAVAMSTYPALAHQLGFGDRAAGFLAGAAIHDVAQAIGGGYAFSDAAGGYATIVKLVRVALLAPVVALIALLVGDEGADEASAARAPKSRWRRLAPPLFLVLFFAVMALNSAVPLPRTVVAGALVAAKALLLLAVTATAMRTRLDQLVATGWRAIVPVIAATAASLTMTLALAALM